MKFKYLLMCLAFLISIQTVYAQETIPENKLIKVYVFWRDGCSACEMLIEELNKIEEEYLDVFEIVTIDVYQGTNGNLYEYISDILGDSGYVPYTVVGTQHISGYNMDAILTAALEESINTDYEDFVGSYAKVVSGFALEDLEHACDIKNINYWNASEKNVNSLLVVSVLIVLISSMGYLIFSPKKM